MGIAEDMAVFMLAIAGASTDDIDAVPFAHEHLWSGDQLPEVSR